MLLKHECRGLMDGIQPSTTFGRPPSAVLCCSVLGSMTMRNGGYAAHCMTIEHQSALVIRPLPP